MIYLIDDDDIQNTINVRIIEIVAPEREVRVFKNAKRALEALQVVKERENEKEPIFLLLDLNMPQMNGWEFLNHFEDRQNPWPVYILTSSINEEDKNRANNYPSVVGFLSKPLTTTTIAKIMAMHE